MRIIDLSVGSAGGAEEEAEAEAEEEEGSISREGARLGA